MENLKTMLLRKNFGYNVLLLIIAFIITAAAVLTGSYMEQGYDLKVGDISNQLFKAPREIVNQVATERLTSEAVAEVSPLYKQDPDVDEAVTLDLDRFFEGAFQLRRANDPVFTPYALDTPAVSEEVTLSIPLSEERRELLVSMEEEKYLQFKNETYSITEAIMAAGIKEDMEAERYPVLISGELEKYELDEATGRLVQTVILAVLRPNLLVDAEATARAKESAAEGVEPVVYLRDQKIVDEGEFITGEIYVTLDALGFINQGNTPAYGLFGGTVLLCGIVFYLFVLYIYTFHHDMLLNKTETTLIFTLSVLTIVIARLLLRLPFQFVPILTATLLTSILLNVRLAMVLNIGLTIICVMVSGGSIEFFFLHTVVGIIAALFSKYTTERNKIIGIGLIACVASAVVSLGTILLVNKTYTTAMLDAVIYAVVNGGFSVIITVGSLLFWEAVFGIVTPLKLLDLTNPTKPLLRELTIHAPGTYHHSLIVANLAETAAFDINANTVLARVGAYYHDIGKLKSPIYFSENQAGYNPHDDLSCEQSVEVIISHVTHGIKLAGEHNLPKPVGEIIRQHHGNTLIKYFYYKVKKEKPEEEINEQDFRYPYESPKTREAALVMIADTVEAAVRSMISSNKAVDEIDTFIETLIRDKFEDGQFNDSGLSIKDLITIRRSFMRVFKGMYHERIAYPKMETPKKKEEHTPAKPVPR